MNLLRPTESIKRLNTDAVLHEFVQQSVHYYGDDCKEHGKDIELVLQYVDRLEAIKAPERNKPCHSVLEVMMILQLSCCDEPIRNADFPAQRSVFRSFLNRGLISSNPSRRSGYSVTPAGQKWCTALLSIT